MVSNMLCSAGCRTLLAAVIVAMAAPVDGQDVQRPNVLLILTDDQGYGDIRGHGNQWIQTPVLDALAASGARLDRFFVSPVCAPTRAALLTGRYHLRTGVHGVTRGYENMRSEEITLAEILAQHGYATGAFGKWHNGRHMPMHPNGQGFATFLGFCGGHWNTYFDPPLEHNGKPIQRKGYIADILTQEAMGFIEQHRERPWFCYVPYNTPHSPWRVPDPYWQKYDHLELDTKAQCAYAMVENIDTNIGKLLDRLGELELEHQTIVLFLSDNGANSDRFNAGMRGRKGSIDEGGTRVPCFIRYPGVIPAGLRVEPITAHLDVLPTVLQFCQVPLPDVALDGRSLVPLLSENKAPTEWPDRLLFTDTYRGERPEQMRGAVRSQRWRATWSGERWRLFDMQRDPGQEQDVAAQHSDVVRRLSQAFDDWFQDVTSEPLVYPAIPVGHPARDLYELPANEAILKSPGDGIAYTGDTGSGFANCWIHQWTDPQAYPEWLIQNLQAQRYRVELSYTCRREDVGCRLVVELAGQRLVVNVPEAVDPPLLPKPDKLFSDNYQDKARWGTLVAGDVALELGTATLAVKIEQLTGGRAIDLQAVRLVPTP